jgi:hypothetical protein
VSDEASIRTPTYRVQRGSAVDPTTKRLALIAAGLGSALLAVLSVWTVSGHRNIGGSSVPVVEPPVGPMRVKPANPGGMQLTPGDDIFTRGSGGDSSTDTLAPPPEIPDPQALRSPPKPVAAAPVPAPSQPTSASPPPAAAMALPPAAPVAIPAQAPPAEAPTAPALKPVVVPPSGHAQVQLAALPTEEGAKQQWAILLHRFPDLLHGRDPAIGNVEVGGHTWWRVRTGGFADLAAARGFCDQVRAKGAACDAIPP